METEGCSISEQRVLDLHLSHPRQFQLSRFVYPVLSRRSRGISVGINLNPDKACNFDCIYCQVDRRVPPAVTAVDPVVVLDELEFTLDLVESGQIYEDASFRAVPEPLRRLRDIAFSGDGEPTACPDLTRIVREVAAIKRRRKLDEVKLIIITNATLFHRPRVVEALRILDVNEGEIWAKLDAGTEEYFHLIDRTNIPFKRIMANLIAAARVRPLVIQSLFTEVGGVGPNGEEVDAYCSRLNEILEAGGSLAGIQVYTVARPPAESNVTALPGPELHQLGELVRRRTGVAVEVFEGATAE
jgi:wyosine [tRNA(Phe)-imidazoG37] synthetase (radical SAM superfamily)